MAVFKNKERGTWTAAFRYTNWKGKRILKKSEGFKTKHEAQAFERDFLLQAERSMDMSFAKFIELYMVDKKFEIRPHTWEKKRWMIEKFLLPYFGDKSLNDISPLDIVQWQNEIAGIKDSEGKGYAPTYLRAIQSELHAVFSHAETFYLLKDNPCKKIRKMGKTKANEMLFWTEDEYFLFRDAISEDPIYFYAFELFFWCGIREGELLALTMEDFDLEKMTLRINKSYQRIKGEDVITDPKTERSNRIIAMPEFLCNEMEDYFASLGKSDVKARIFPGTKSKLHHLMDKYSEKAGVQRIRIHDLRHSCVAMLINQGFSSYLIADRLGHENVHITETYAHLYPSKQKEMADKLNDLACSKFSMAGGNNNEAV